MVVDLAVDSKGQGAIVVKQGLGSSICARSALKANAARVPYQLRRYSVAHGPRLAVGQFSTRFPGRFLRTCVVRNKITT